MELIIPALYTVKTAQDDTRQIAITINTIFEGACFGKHSFSMDSINSAAQEIQNLAIMAEDESCAVGVIPESTDTRWTKVKVGDKWRNYLQVDAILWAKLETQIPDLDNTADFYGMELNLSDIEAELQENGLYSVTKFKIDGCKICSQTPENQNTTFSSRYGLLPQR